MRAGSQDGIRASMMSLMVDDDSSNILTSIGLVNRIYLLMIHYLLVSYYYIYLKVSHNLFILIHMSVIENQEKQVLQRLKEAREKAQLSQLELSYRSGVSQNMITYIETGKRTPTLTTLLKLCNALNITPAILFADSSEDIKSAKATVIDLINRYMN